jgi:hypothetical protein
MPHNVIPLAARHYDDPRLATPHPSGEYRLAEADRQAILAQSPSAQAAREVERLRLQFIQQHGDAFGMDAEEASVPLLQQKP